MARRVVAYVDDRLPPFGTTGSPRKMEAKFSSQYGPASPFTPLNSARSRISLLRKKQRISSKEPSGQVGRRVFHDKDSVSTTIGKRVVGQFELKAANAGGVR